MRSSQFEPRKDAHFGRNSYLSIDGREAYHFGIIDYLQAWNIQKKCEAWYKSTLKGKNKHKISAIPPEPYQARFCEFIEDNVLISRKALRKKMKSSIYFQSNSAKHAINNSGSMRGTQFYNVLDAMIESPDLFIEKEDSYVLTTKNSFGTSMYDRANLDFR